MSFLDRVTKAVGDAVDRGKKEVDQFVRIQKINGQIGESEKKITQCRADIEQVKVNIGEHAVQMLRAGTLQSAELQALVDTIGASEQQITAEEAVIAEKRAEIEKIKAEDDKTAAALTQTGPTAAATTEPPTLPPPLPVAPPAPAERPDPVHTEQAPAAAGTAAPAIAQPARFCPQCGATAPESGSFCMQCGAKLTTPVA